MAEPQLKSAPKGTKIPGDFPRRRKTDIMPEDITLVIQRTDRIETKLDTVIEGMQDGNGRFATLEERTKNQGHRITALEDNQKKLLWLVLALILGFIIKTLLTI